MKIIVIYLVLEIVSVKAISQNIITTSKRVVYFDYQDTLKSRQIRGVVQACNYLIEKSKVRKESPVILLDIEITNDSTYYQLGYDNIYGSSVFNSIYKPKTNDYRLLGIRIKYCDSLVHIEKILKLLEYGLMHLKELHRLREKAMRLDFYDKPRNITLRNKKIISIIGRHSSKRVKETISYFLKLPGTL